MLSPKGVKVVMNEGVIAVTQSTLTIDYWEVLYSLIIALAFGAGYNTTAVLLDYDS